MLSFNKGDKVFLNGDIVKIQIRMEKISETIDNLKELK